MTRRRRPAVTFDKHDFQCVHCFRLPDCRRHAITLGWPEIIGAFADESDVKSEKVRTQT